jgi:PKD repeat protein
MSSKMLKAVVFTLVLFLLVTPSLAFAGGDGSSSNPYEISTCQQLQDMENDLGAHYELVTNIDCSGTSSWNELTGETTEYSNDHYLTSGETVDTHFDFDSIVDVVNTDDGTSMSYTVVDDNTIELNEQALDNVKITYNPKPGQYQGFRSVGEDNNAFSGSLDGRGYTVDGLTIKDVTLSEVGLIGQLGTGGEINDIGLTNVNIYSDIVEVGGLVGFNYGSISNSYTTGSVSGDSNVGGLVGTNYAGISNSHSTADVSGYLNTGGLIGGNSESPFNSIESRVSNSYSTGSVSADLYHAGGLVGHLYDGSVSNSYSTGSISGDANVGGLIGNFYDGSVSNSYSTGSASSNDGDDEVGGLIGRFNDGSISDSYWDTESSGLSTSAGGIGLTTGEMQGEACGMMGLSESDWNFFSGSYPDLDAFSSGGLSTDCVPMASLSGPSSLGIDESGSFDASGSNDRESSSLSYSWNVDSGSITGSSGIESWSSPGTYTVEVTVTDGDGNSDSSSIIVDVSDQTPPSISNPSPTGTVNTGSPIISADFSDNYNVDSYSLDLDGSQVDSGSVSGTLDSASYSTSGLSEGQHQYTWYLTDSAGNSASRQESFTVDSNSPPAASFSSDSPVLTAEDFGLDASGTSDPDGDSLTYEWDTDNDGSYDDATGVTPSVSKADDGSYTIGLRVSDGNGGSDTTTGTVNVENRPPSASFSFSPSGPEVGGSVSFVDGSNDPDGSISSYSWSFGDGSSSSLENPSHSFSSIGDYTVELTVTDDDGESDSFSDNVSVSGVNASFVSGSPVAVGQGFELNASGSEGSGSLSYEWDTDDDGSYDDASGVSPTVSETSPGVYNVSVYVSNDDGLSDVASREVVVYDMAGGSGTAADPYQISSCQHLQNIEYNISAYYELIQNVDCSNSSDWNSGIGFDPLGDPLFTGGSPFTGNFDGTGFVVTNLTIDRGIERFVGLFGVLGDSGVVERVGVKDVDISGRSEVGGLVGLNDGGSVYKTFTTGSVSGDLNFVGGLVGDNLNGDVSKSYSSAVVSGRDYVGGLVGDNEGGTISNVFSYSAVTGDSQNGGLVGYNGGTVTDGYWDEDAYIASGGLNPVANTLTSSKMKGSSAPTYMSGLDFTSTWRTVAEGELGSGCEEYPILRDLHTEYQIDVSGCEYGVTGVSSGNVTLSGNPRVPADRVHQRIKEIMLGEGLGKGLAGKLKVNFSSDFNVSNVSFENARGIRKAFIHLNGSYDQVEEKTLLVPREVDSGVVRVCPGADALDEVSRSCSGGYVVESGETVNGVTNTEVTVNGDDYYELSGISGTGGQELIDWSTEPDAASITGSETFDRFRDLGGDSVDTFGGNITYSNVTAKQTTVDWAGIYGNASGSIRLGSDSSFLYTWEPDIDEVFASNHSVNWSVIGNGSASEVDSYYGLDGSDSAVETFNLSVSVDFEDQIVDGVPAVRTYNSSGGRFWLTGVLTDDDPVFYGEPRGGEAFNGVVSDYQLIVPSTGGLTSYQLYLELN